VRIRRLPLEPEKRAYATIDRKLAGVVVTLRLPPYKVIVDPEATKAARKLLKDYRRQAEEDEEPTRGRGKAPAMRLVDLRLIVSKCDTDIFGLRDRAMLLLGFAIAARRAELAGLRLRNIRDDDNGLLVDVRVSKTEPRTVPSPTVRTRRPAPSAPGRPGRRPPASPTPTGTPSAASTTPAPYNPRASPRSAPATSSPPPASAPDSRNSSPDTPCAPAWPPRHAVPERTARPSPPSPGMPTAPRSSTATCRSSTSGTEQDNALIGIGL
jgi:hypothetical protein